MKLRPKDAGNGIILPARELETIASVPSEFPPWYKRCRDCVHAELPVGVLALNDEQFWGRALCGKFRDPDTGKPVRGIWFERYGFAASFNDITQESEGPVRVGRCGPLAEYFERKRS